MLRLPDPMLARTGEIPSAAGWVFEPKLDGFRCLICTHAGRFRARSRRGWEMSDSLPELHSELPADVQLDGELVAWDNTVHAFREASSSWLWRCTLMLQDNVFICSKRVIAPRLRSRLLRLQSAGLWSIARAGMSRFRGRVVARAIVRCSGQVTPSGRRLPARWESLRKPKGGFACDVFVFARHEGSEIEGCWQFYVLPERVVSKAVSRRPGNVTDIWLYEQGAKTCDWRDLRSKVLTAARKQDQLTGRHRS